VGLGQLKGVFGGSGDTDECKFGQMHNALSANGGHCRRHRGWPMENSGKNKQNIK